MSNKAIPVLKNNFFVNGNMIDYNKNMKLYDILSLTQEHGEQHATLLGFSMQENAKKDAFFVLMRQRIDILQNPKPFTHISTETWPGHAKRAIFPRFHRFFDEDENLAITISTLWMLCSIESRQIIRDPEVLEAMPIPIFDDLELPEKLRFDHEPSLQVEHSIAYSDLDCYGHVNNRKYVEWCCDIFELKKFDEFDISQFQINYVSELKYGETIVLNAYENNDTFSVEGIKKSDQKRAFLASGVWKKRS